MYYSTKNPAVQEVLRVCLARSPICNSFFVDINQSSARMEGKTDDKEGVSMEGSKLAAAILGEVRRAVLDGQFQTWE